MHLKSYPKLVRSELRLDASGVQTSQRGPLLRTCSGNHGNIISGRLPFSVLSTNTLRCVNATNGSAASMRLKASASGGAPQLPVLPPGCENDTLRLYRAAAEDADAPLDIWTVIKPGHVREKIAIFASDDEHTDGTGGSERTSGGDRTPAACTNHGAAAGPLRAGKAKGSWEENCSAKRRRRSGNNQQDPRTRDAQQHARKPSPRRLDWTQRSSSNAEEEEQKVSVVEMVAFLEQIASEQQPDTKPLLAIQRSSATITLSRAPPPEVRGEEPESVRVSDMVAKLESECLRRRTEGDLSRSNSLRRTVGRVLLAATADQSPAPCQVLSSLTSSSLPGRESPVSALTASPSGETLSAITETQARPPPSEEEEPLPGLLFLSPASEPRPPRHRTTFDPEPHPPSARCDSGSQSEKRRRRRKPDRPQEEAGGGVAPAGLRVASQDFLLMRQRVQQLLEPQPFLAVLPHHVLLSVLRLLPTQSLAALKCTCRYFKFVIDDYGVRPADSLWVSDPRYRDDPCKQCKKHYRRGDVSLCRWHHKPYCQALPYGPGYWMCCHGARRDAPGCNVGLHDNRWVPAFHSINVPIYRRGRHDD